MGLGVVCGKVSGGAYCGDVDDPDFAHWVLQHAGEPMCGTRHLVLLPAHRTIVPERSEGRPAPRAPLGGVSALLSSDPSAQLLVMSHSRPLRPAQGSRNNLTPHKGGSAAGLKLLRSARKRATLHWPARPSFYDSPAVAAAGIYRKEH
jgi:hypothetical protein